MSYAEHDDIITSLTQYPNMEGLFFSGSRDATIKLWDPRTAKSVGMKKVTVTEGEKTRHEEKRRRREETRRGEQNS